MFEYGVVCILLFWYGLIWFPIDGYDEVVIWRTLTGGLYHKLVYHGPTGKPALFFYANLIYKYVCL
jgi:hypothetical protein